MTAALSVLFTHICPCGGVLHVLILMSTSSYSSHCNISCVTEHAEAGLTDEAEDVSNGGHEDDQHVVEGQDGGSNHHVASPAELSMAEQQCGNGRADLGGKKIRGC